MTTKSATADAQARQQINRFASKYGESTRELARHAAFAMTVTSDLLVCLRENFVPEAPWYAGADILLSGFCDPIGYDLYEMNGPVRRVLLAELSHDRLTELMAFMRDYVAVRFQVEGDRAWVLGDPPEWTALPYLYGETAAWERIRADLLAMVRDADQRRRLYIISLLENYAETLLPTQERPILQWVEALEQGEEDGQEARSLESILKVQFQPVTFETAQVRIGSASTEIDPTARQTFEFETVQVNRRGAIVQRETRSTWGYVERLGDVGLEMVAIPGGTFTMGSPEDEPERWDDEGPQHEVTVPPFFMGRYAVTQAQWKVVAGWKPVERKLKANPSNFKGDNRPVEQITWQDATEFCARLRRETGRDYSLPSEAEWEYACRSNTQTAFHFGDMISPEVANYDWNFAYNGVKQAIQKSFEGTVAVGHFPANPWGLYEMHGNVWEWCEDHWHDEYDRAPIDETAETDAERVIRGGSWFDVPRNCRSATRHSNVAHFDYVYGFRVVCRPPRTL